MKLPLKKLAILLIIFIVSILFFASSFGRAAYKSLLLTSLVIEQFVIKPPAFLHSKVSVDEINVENSGKTFKARIFRPEESGQFPTMILSIGVTPRGIEDEFLARFATSLAKIGFVAVVPEVFEGNFTEEEDINQLVSTVKVVRDLNYVDKEKLGFVGFCVGGSFSMIAASDDEISQDVSYLVLLSPYFDNINLIESVVTKKTVIDSREIDWEPASLTYDVLVGGYTRYIETFHSRDDAKIIREAFEKNRPLTDEEVGSLSEGSRVMYNTLSAKSHEEFEDLINIYPQAERQALENTSPKNFVDNLDKSAKFFALSDKQDTFVPRSETLAFRKAFPKGKFVEIDSFEHVRPSTRLERLSAITQIARVFSFIHGILWETYKN